MGLPATGVVRFFEDAIATYSVARTSRGFLMRKASKFMEQ
jgi:hypothetical protein